MNKIALISLSLIVALVVGLAGCVTQPAKTVTVTPSTPTTYSGPDTVVYEITGSADRVNVTLSNATGGTEQFSNVRLPHQYKYYSFPEWFLYISAQNQGEHGSVTVTIYLNGEVFKTSTSSGAYVIASASGTK